MALDVLLCIAGFVLLYYGAEWLVRGSSSLARSLGVSRIVIGLTVVAFGTSTPELVVSAIASFKGNSMIAVGNVVGSNICNIALILGLSAIFQPLTCHWSVVKRDIPIMIWLSLAALVLTLDSKIGRIDGTVLLGGIIAYTLFNYRTALRDCGGAPFGEKEDEETKAAEQEFIASRPGQVAVILLGLSGVIGGAHLVVESAVTIMKVLGLSEKFIGLTIVAFGTSLPELATSVVAALRKEMDISIGNVIGSNVFNLLAVLGLASLISPIVIPGGFIQSGLLIDYLVMVVISALPWVFMRANYTITRTQGIFLIVCYGGYLTFLVLRG
ncbi:MAG: calcium/sodium antiporter [Desulfomonilaceae bacterium]|nr:calcium/sodium antiporter [Desulfomonilaceae bacterium]